MQSETVTPCYRNPRTEWSLCKSDLLLQLGSLGRRVSCCADIRVDQVASDLQVAMMSCFHDNYPLERSVTTQSDELLNLVTEGHKLESFTIIVKRYLGAISQGSHTI